MYSLSFNFHSTRCGGRVCGLAITLLSILIYLLAIYGFSPIYSGLHLSFGGKAPPYIPRIFRALIHILSFPRTSLYASKLYLRYLNLLYPLFSSVEPHCDHSEDVPLGSIIASSAPCFIACQSIHLPSLEYPIIMSFALWFLGSLLRASMSPVRSSLANAC